MKSYFVIFLILLVEINHVYCFAGSGSTFSRLAIQDWMRVDAKIEYLPTSSGEGLESFFNKTYTFAASEIPITEQDYQDFPTTQAIPILGGAVVPRVNLGRGNEFDFRPLLITPDILVDIFMRRITMWNDTRIQVLNPERTIFGSNITPVIRVGRSGTTRAATEYFSAVSPDWAAAFGVVDEWPEQLLPGTLRATSNKEILDTCRVFQFSIGMVGYPDIKLGYDVKFFARILNSAGVHTTVNEATIDASILPATFDGRTVSSVVDPVSPIGWPICTITYIYLDSRNTDSDRCQELAEVVNLLGDAMRFHIYTLLVNNNRYLNNTIVSQVLDILADVECDGLKLYDPNGLPTEDSYQSYYVNTDLSPFSPSVLQIPSSFDPPYYDSIGNTIPSSEAPTYSLSPLSFLNESSQASDIVQVSFLLLFICLSMPFFL